MLVLIVKYIKSNKLIKNIISIITVDFIMNKIFIVSI